MTEVFLYVFLKDFFLDSFTLSYVFFVIPLDSSLYFQDSSMAVMLFFLCNLLNEVRSEIPPRTFLIFPYVISLGYLLEFDKKFLLRHLKKFPISRISFYN